jgi:hypothetical protein
MGQCKHGVSSKEVCIACATNRTSYEEEELRDKVIEAAKAQRRALRARPPLGSSDHNAAEWSRYVREAVDAYEAALDSLEAAEGEE